LGIDELRLTAEPAFYRLLRMESHELYEELGARAAVVRDSPKTAGEFDLMVDRAAIKDGPASLRRAGERVFLNHSRAAYGLLCGGGEADSEARTTVFDALGLSDIVAVTVTATVLVLKLRMAPAFAAVVAVLLYRLVFEATAAPVCRVWKEKLGE
jgi:hypothetical protein